MRIPAPDTGVLRRLPLIARDEEREERALSSKAKLFGHPIHPMLIPFPLGLLSTSVIFDVIYLLTDNGKWSEIAFWMIAAGVIGGLAAAVFDLIGWLAIPSGTRAKSVGLWHGAGNVVVVVLFVVSWLIRADAPGEPSRLFSRCWV